MRNGMIRTMSVWAGGAVAVLVVLLLTTLLAHMAAVPSDHPSGSSGEDGTPLPTPGLVATGTPTIGSKYVTSAVTARGVNSNYTPVDLTSTFTVGQRVYVVVQVRNPPAGQHRLSIAWYLNGQPVNLPRDADISKQVSGSANVYFSLNYPQAGRGTARIYWDLPADNYDLDPDAFLARDVAFEVQSPPGAPSATPQPTVPPTPQLGQTPPPYSVATPTMPPTPTPTPGS